MIEDIRSLPIEGVVGGITSVAQTAREADKELTLALAYAHRVMSPPLSLPFCRVPALPVHDPLPRPCPGRDGGTAPPPRIRRVRAARIG